MTAGLLAMPLIMNAIQWLSLSIQRHVPNTMF
jgi:hypothetical protein